MNPPTADSTFLNALEISPDEREAYLESACGQDVGLRQRVERLLTAHQKAATEFLEDPAAGLAGSADVEPKLLDAGL
jgi:hypothetical protein